MPNKGALAKPAQQIAGFLGFDRANGKNYVSISGRYNFLQARARDIPNYVQSSVADLGITGRDVVLEQQAQVQEVFSFPFGRCRLVYAVPKGVRTVPSRVATSFPNLASKFLADQKISAQVVTLSGAIEASVSVGIADAVIDLVDTGKTLAANGLEEKVQILASNAVLIANPQSLATKLKSIDQAISQIRGDFTIFKGKLVELSPPILRKLSYRNQARSPEVRKTVSEVFDNVEKNKDEALQEYTLLFNKVRLSPKQFQASSEEIKRAYAVVSDDVVAALKRSAENIERFARKQLPERFEIKMEGGLAGRRIVPLDSVGVYAPCGMAAYPSSVLMGVIPAKVAGVSEIVICTPPNAEGRCNPSVLVAADLVGATKIFKLGGAQAIAAMAFGTRTVPRVAKIIGPGNAFVVEAKLEAMARGLVSIDSPAGPSEVLVIADQTADPALVASELIAQAEHSPDAAAVLVSTSSELADKVLAELQKQNLLQERKEIIRRALSQSGAILVAEDLDQAIEFANQYAPEHLVLTVERPFTWMKKVRTAGTIFLGNDTPVAAGDYAAGPNHVLPTGGAARAYSGLSAKDFVREVSYLKLEKRGLKVLAPSIMALAQAEGLAAHAESVMKRFERSELS